MRGKQTLAAAIADSKRITPAHAGKTRYSHFKSFISKDHPRACGENRLILALCLTALGSPPRMRGKHLVFGFDNKTEGITPAHAGKTNNVLIKNGMW